MRKNMSNNENITNITEVIINQNRFGNRFDVSEYKWKLVSDNQNEPTQVHFYKDDMNDKLSVRLSTLFDSCLKEYNYHLEEVERKKKRELEEEIKKKKEKLLDEKLDEHIESYELFVKQSVKDELNERMTNEDNEYYEEDLKFNLTNIRCVVDSCFKNGRGIHLGIGSRKENSYSFSEEWYLENYEKLNQTILLYDPNFETCSSPVSENQYKTKFMNIDGHNPNNWNGTDFKYRIYDKLILLHRRMKKDKIGYWKSK